MFARMKLDPVRRRDAKINEGDVFVPRIDPVCIDKGGCRKRFNPWVPDIRRFGENTHFQTALLMDLAVKRLFGVLIKLNVTADRQPLVVPLVINQEDFAAMNNKNGYNKIIKIMNVRQNYNTRRLLQGNVTTRPGDHDVFS